MFDWIVDPLNDLIDGVSAFTGAVEDNFNILADEVTTSLANIYNQLNSIQLYGIITMIMCAVIFLMIICIWRNQSNYSRNISELLQKIDFLSNELLKQTKDADEA